MENEVSAIIAHLKEWVEIYQEMGFDPPAVHARKTEAEEEPRRDGSPQEQGATDFKTLEALQAFIGECTRCKLHHGRKKIVFGEGNPRARLVFVGEGPGRDEDIVGKPFVGEAGKLLTRIIENGMKLPRGDVYICNVVKCRPPGNRDPQDDEVKICLPFLLHQIRIIKPEVICALGRVAAQTLLGDQFRITKDRGVWRSFQGIPLMPTFHPAYLLRNPAAKRAVWEDVQEIMRRLGLGGAEND